MGRPKKENKLKTQEEIEHDLKLKDLERDVIRQVVQARKSQKLSQRVVGERAGIIRETVAKIENNLNSPQINTLIKLLEPIGYTLGVVPLVKDEEVEEQSTEKVEVVTK
jgi:transcriptional regulator with XRE-family HTH domain